MPLTGSVHSFPFFTQHRTQSFHTDAPDLLLGGPVITFHRLGLVILMILHFQADLCFSEYWQEILKAQRVDDLVMLFSFPFSYSLRFVTRVVGE